MMAPLPLLPDGEGFLQPLSEGAHGVRDQGRERPPSVRGVADRGVPTAPGYRWKGEVSLKCLQ